MSEINACLLCAGEGVDLEGSPCECQKVTETPFALFDKEVCTFIPQQYQAIRFDKSLLPTIGASHYPAVMQEIYEDSISRRVVNMNILITSPAKTGKSVMSYSVIQNMYAKNLPVFPYYDVMELRKLMRDIDASKEYLHDNIKEYKLEDLYRTPLLFVKIPLELDVKVCDAIALLVDRRTRRGHSTIFMSQHSWEAIAKNDYNGTFKSLMGDGSFGTIKKYNFW